MDISYLFDEVEDYLTDQYYTVDNVLQNERVVTFNVEKLGHTFGLLIVDLTE